MYHTVYVHIYYKCRTTKHILLTQMSHNVKLDGAIEFSVYGIGDDADIKQSKQMSEICNKLGHE